MPVPPPCVKLAKYNYISMSVLLVHWWQTPWIQIVIYGVIPELRMYDSTEAHDDAGRKYNY